MHLARVSPGFIILINKCDQVGRIFALLGTMGIAVRIIAQRDDQPDRLIQMTDFPNRLVVEPPKDARCQALGFCFSCQIS